MTAASYDAIIGDKVIENRSLGREVRQVKMAIIPTAATAAQGDTYTFDLTKLGGTTLLGVYSVYHDTTNSVIAANAITTTVASSVVTFTIPAAGGTKARASKIYFM